MKKEIAIIALLISSSLSLRAQTLVIPPLDTLKVVNDLAKSTCDELKEAIIDGEIATDDFVQISIEFLFTGDNYEKIKNLSGDYSIGTEKPKPEYIDKGFKKVFQACIEQCSAVDTFLQYDGHQRPAYAHLSKAGCDCMDQKMKSFKDMELAYIKFPFLRDSCYQEIFSDPKNIQIVHTANNFQSKAELDAFNRNFTGYFAKNCSIIFDVVIHNLKQYIQKEETAAPNIQPYELKRSEGIHHVIHAFAPSLGASTNTKTVDYFVTPRAYQTALPIMNSLKTKFKNYSVVDYIPNITKRSDGIVEHRYTFFTRLIKTKKRHILGQVVFEFENKSELIAVFKFFGRDEIGNLASLQTLIDNN